MPVAEHFDGKIVELKHEQKFFEIDFLKSFLKKAIAEDNHFLVNGYANSWYIRPEDVGGKEEYTLLLEYLPQRSFYIGGAISLFGLIVVLLLGLVKFVLKK